MTRDAKLLQLTQGDQPVLLFRDFLDLGVGPIHLAERNKTGCQRPFLLHTMGFCAFALAIKDHQPTIPRDRWRFCPLND